MFKGVGYGEGSPHFFIDFITARFHRKIRHSGQAFRHGRVRRHRVVLRDRPARFPPCRDPGHAGRLVFASQIVQPSAAAQSGGG